MRRGGDVGDAEVMGAGFTSFGEGEGDAMSNGKGVVNIYCAEMDGYIKQEGLSEFQTDQFIYKGAIDHVYIRSTILQGSDYPFGEAF